MLSLSFVDFITVLVVAPGTVSIQVGQQDIPGVFKFRAVEPQAHQPYPEGEQFVVAVCFLHDCAALVDRLGGHSEAQVDICRRPVSVEGGVKTAEFHSAPVKDSVEV